MVRYCFEFDVNTVDNKGKGFHYSSYLITRKHSGKHSGKAEF